MTSCEMSENSCGAGVPEMLAEVETIGRFNLPINFFQNTLSTIRMAKVPSDEITDGAIL